VGDEAHNEVAMKVLALLLLPLTASAGDLYAQAGIGYQFHHPACTLPTGQVAQYCRWDRTEYQPLLAHIELGYTVRQGRFSADLYVRHESLPTIRQDFGVDHVGVSGRVVLWHR
jgi:hypothetical protein